MKKLHTIGIAGALLVGTICAQIPTLAYASSNSLANAKGSRIVGVYDVTVDLYTCDSNVYITSFPALHKFELGGTGQVAPAGNSPAVAVHMMVWEYLGNNTWSTAIKFFRYNESGVIGTTVLTFEAWLSEDGTQYGGSGISELYDLDGNWIGVAGCPSLSGTRFTVGS